MKPWMGALLALGLTAGAARAAEEVKPVKLAAETQVKLGLTVQKLAGATRSASINGFAKVLDAGPLAQLDSDLQAAEAASAASGAEAARSKTLNADDQAVSAKALQAAEAQARADASKLALLRRRVGLEWGEGVARLSDHQRAALIADIASGKAALVRIDTASGQGQAGLKSAEIDLGPLGVAHAVVLGVARAADPRLQSPGLIAKVSGPAARNLSAGLSAPVKLTTSGPVHGVVAPREALLRSDGKTWIYVQTAAEQFIRKPVEDATPDQAGLFTATGFHPGEPAVIKGAAALFAAETNVGEAAGD